MNGIGGVMAELILRTAEGHELVRCPMDPDERYAKCQVLHRRWARAWIGRTQQGEDMAGFSLQQDEQEDQRPEGIWTPYGPDVTEEEKAEGKKREAFKLRPLRPKNMDHFRKMAVPKNKWVNNQRVTDPDPDQYNALLYDYLIEDWEGIYEDDAHKIPAPCTLDYKLILAGKSLERANFVILQGSLYANDDEARKAAQRESFRRSPEISTRLQGAQVQ
jgi:hypothetical protein